MSPAKGEHHQYRIIAAAAERFKDLLPESLLQLLDGINTHNVKFSLAEQYALKKPDQPLPSVWAETAIYLTVKESAYPGYWDNTVTPYLVGIMDSTRHPAVSCVVLRKPPQTGGSQLVNILMGYGAKCDPGPVLLVYPDSDTTKGNIKEKLIPLLKNSPVLSELLTLNPDDLAAKGINLKTCHIHPGWSRFGYSTWE